MQSQQQAPEQKPKREYNFKPGRSGNPAGRLDGKRYRETFAALAAELGGEASLSASQRVIVDQVAKLKASIGKRDQVRVANTVAKLMRLLGVTAKARPAAGHVPMRERLGGSTPRPAAENALAANSGTSEGIL
jgi:hypothetical protein